MTTAQSPRPIADLSRTTSAGPALQVLLTNNVTLNTGDAAILLGTMRILRSAFGCPIEFSVRDQQAEVAQRHYPDLSFGPWPQHNARRPARVRRLARVARLANRVRYGLGLWAFRVGAPGASLLTDAERADAEHYNRADLIISTGGTYLVENYGLHAPIFDLQLTRRLRRPLVLFTQSLGPFTAPRTSSALRRIFRRADLILLRDDRSRAHLRALGASGANAIVSSDAAFALADEAVLKRAGTLSPVAGRPLRVGISVRDWAHFRHVDSAVGMERFRRAVGALTTHLVRERGAEVTFLSTCQGVPEYWTDDAGVAREIVALLAKDVRDSVTVDRAFHRPEELMALLFTQDLVVSTRMHLAILSLAAGVPAVPIAYEFKTAELFGRLGLGRWVQDIEQATGASLIAGVDGFIAALPDLRADLFVRVAAERSAAFASGRHVRSAFERHRRTRTAAGKDG